MKTGFKLGGTSTSGPIGNEISHILVDGLTVWVLAGEGLSMTDDVGATWTTYTQADGMGKGGPTALSLRNGVMWVSTAFDTTPATGENLPAGGGLGYTLDYGETWTWFKQPIDSVDESRYKPTTTNVQNLTYDIAQTDSAVWITSFGGGLRKSEDMGQTWEVVTVNGEPFAPLDYLSHRTFSVIYDEEALWVGSADGIHKSTDHGRNWITFNHQNQTESISGNFVVALASQTWKGQHILWASTIEATDEDEFRAVSKSTDGGLTWQIHLEGIWTYNFAIYDSVIYAATDHGLYKSIDFGETWAVYTDVRDRNAGDGLLTEETYSAGFGPGGVLWLGSAGGLARSMDAGVTWDVFRSFASTANPDVPETYAYPNPFSSTRFNLVGGDGHVRFQYHLNGPGYVSVKVYDFGMNLVSTVVTDRYRAAAGDYAEAWNGKNDLGEPVANDVYFYCIEVDDGRRLWGKLIVMN